MNQTCTKQPIFFEEVFVWILILPYPPNSHLQFCKRKERQIILLLGIGDTFGRRRRRRLKRKIFKTIMFRKLN
jgi:hypothetical protein